MTNLTLHWTRDLTLPACDLDDDHHRLLAKLNALLVAAPSGNATRITMAFGAVMGEARLHFAREEAQMLAVRFPDAEEHVEKHRNLLRMLTALRYSINVSQRFAASVNPYVFLDRWFTPHLIHDDRKLADFVSTRASRERSEPALSDTSAPAANSL
jgi:hemerythrin-like metal-binding protein